MMLREEVARAICEARALVGTTPAKPAPWSSDVDKRAADAAIALVLERAAQVIEGAQSEAISKGLVADSDNSRRNYAAAAITSESILVAIRNLAKEQ